MNIKIRLVVLLIGLSKLVFAQVDFPSEFENPNILGQGKEEARVEFISTQEVSSKLSLNGTWKINWVKDPSKRPTKFYENNFDVSTWDNFEVPGNFEISGYGIPIYVNTNYEFADPRKVITKMSSPNPPHVPHDYNPVSSLKRNFELNEKGKPQCN
jgi:beta-galactosidase